MNLKDHMDVATADVTADTAALVSNARKRGLGMRRRRQVLSTFGAAAAVTAIVGGALALQHDSSRTNEDVGLAQDPTSTSTALSGKTVPLTGRGTAAALKAAVDEVADGSFSHFRGQDSSDFVASVPLDSFAELRLAPEGEGFGVVGVNVQPLSILDERNCAKGVKECPSVRPKAYTCDNSFMLDCAVEVLPSGDTLRTYRDQGKGIRLVAEYLSPARELRVVASATNGLELPRSQWDIQRPDAVLTTDQLVSVVSLPWWGVQLPAEYDGSNLKGYEDIGGSLAASALPNKG